MAKLDVARASGALILAAVLVGCSSTSTQLRASQDRTPSWQKYHVSGSRIARRIDKSGKPISADFVQSTTSEGLQQLPGVTMMPCSANRRGC